MLDSVDKYNKIFGLETLHPMVSVVDLSQATQWPEHFKVNYGVYALFLKNTKCGDITYGRQPYDYQEGTIVCFAPGQVAEVTMAKTATPRDTGCCSTPISFAAPLWDRKSRNTRSSPTKPVRRCTSRKRSATR